MRRIKAKLAVLVVSLFGLAFLSGGCATQSGSTGAAEPQGQAESLVSIDNITSSETADATIVTVSADGPLTFSSFKKPDPLSVVLVFPATTTRNLGGPPELGSDLIDQVLIGDGNAGRTARVEFQLAADTTYTARKAGNTVLLTFSRPEGVSPAARVPGFRECRSRSSCRVSGDTGNGSLAGLSAAGIGCGYLLQ
jgi:hypothetical protein